MEYTLKTTTGFIFKGHQIKILMATWGNKRKEEPTLTLYNEKEIISFRCSHIKELLPEVLKWIILF